MTDIKHDDPGSLLRPLKALGFFGRPAVTQKLAPRQASANYRGFHVNDWDKCVGCSTCQKVCDNAAITMVRIPGLPTDLAKGVRDERPAIDYGRCCWCGLCVDICPTGSLALSREYVHTCTDDELDSYFVLPDPKGVYGHLERYGTGWAKSADADLVDLKRQAMPELEPERRIGNFEEMVLGYDDQRALIEASRCVQCGMCHDACPTHMDAPQYIRAIWEGKVEEAVRWIYRTNPFAHVCGRVCTHRCEDACSIGHRGEPIAIRWLKRYAMDAVPHEQVKAIALADKVYTPTGKRVAVIGSGPAGLTAAYDLAMKGHAVTVFEAQPEPGGMVRYGIPEYRLPYDRLDRDIDVIRSAGVDLRCNVRVGRDVALDRVRAEHDAVLLTIGLQEGRQTRIPNSENEKVFRSVDLLARITADEPFELPHCAVVIGGGNVAMDIARSLARLQHQRYGKVDVVLTALEDQEHFLADPSEIKEAIEEGVVIHDRCGPQGCEIDPDGKLVGLKTWKVLSIFDENKRFSPRYDETDETIFACDTVVEAIGQYADTSLLGDALTEALEWNRGRIRVDANGRTSESWLWSAGDCVNGPDVVHAVADGHRVAASIHATLTGTEPKK